MNYVLAKLNSTSSVDRPADASNNILYYQLYEELKTQQIKLYTAFQPDYCVFVIYLYPIHIPTTRLRTTSIIFNTHSYH